MCEITYFDGEARKLQDFVGLLFEVPRGIDNLPDLFSAYGKGMLAPNDYFGKNWDAFSDCLTDLQWIEMEYIHIVHHDLPKLSSKDASTYLDVIREASLIWSKRTKENSGYPGYVHHVLKLYFPSYLKEGIDSSGR